ncbi:ABC transporter permease [Diplocloster modestus]|uniref:ABC transporter permease n=1 Tax=Diplocloster modestus TaxID=2850322 RepID=UPI001EE880BA|nr:ABC transporter permease [Diplocloster modestus]
MKIKPGNLKLKKFFLQWEWMLILIFLIINIVNASISEYYLNLSALVGITQSFLDKAFIVLPMTFVLLLGEIDISPASTVALSSVIMAVSYNYLGVPMGVAVLICLGAGLLCGMFNGLVLVKFPELPPMIVTLATQLLYRGIALLILEDQACGGFPDWFLELGWGEIAGIPLVLFLFVLCAVIFTLLLHKTNFGRYVYAIDGQHQAERGYRIRAGCHSDGGVRRSQQPGRKGQNGGAADRYFYHRVPALWVRAYQPAVGSDLNRDRMSAGNLGIDSEHTHKA